MSLGYPLAIGVWGINVMVDNKLVPLAFSSEQAKEIARRIIVFYGKDEVLKENNNDPG